MALDQSILQDMTVLVIDDDQQTLRAAQVVLERLGASVITASDGADGLKRVQKAEPDIIFTELNVPLVDGWELYELLQSDADFRSIPLVAFTAQANTYERKKAQDIGFAGYIEKPFTPAQLRQAIDGIVAAS